MNNKIKHFLSFLFGVYESNLAKIIFIIFLHAVTIYIVNLPYINIFTSLISFFPFIIDWIAITVLFKPSSRLIFWVGIVTLLLSFPFLLIRLSIPAEILGNISYLMFGTYLIFSLREFREKNKFN
jgi:hypothetical protein